MFECLARKYSIYDLFDENNADLFEKCKTHGFNIKDDFKELRSFKIADQYKIFLNSITTEYELQKGKYVVFRLGTTTIEKLRFQDEYRQTSKSSGFRLLCIFDIIGDEVLIIPIHIFMHNGAQGKRDLSENEKKWCRKLVEDLNS